MRDAGWTSHGKEPVYRTSPSGTASQPAAAKSTKLEWWLRTRSQPPPHAGILNSSRWLKVAGLRAHRDPFPSPGVFWFHSEPAQRRAVQPCGRSAHVRARRRSKHADFRTHHHLGPSGTQSRGYPRLWLPPRRRPPRGSPRMHLEAQAEQRAPNRLTSWTSSTQLAQHSQTPEPRDVCSACSRAGAPVYPSAVSGRRIDATGSRGISSHSQREMRSAWEVRENVPRRHGGRPQLALLA
mmetsp:Transcript_43659/g.114751  ORF Transcript_43659/g.114751 Transcript_43659/m.114751 type:complete len:238 (+) Transcript_43659:193-906(+)